MNSEGDGVPNYYYIQLKLPKTDNIQRNSHKLAKLAKA